MSLRTYKQHEDLCFASVTFILSHLLASTLTIAEVFIEQLNLAWFPSGQGMKVNWDIAVSSLRVLFLRPQRHIKSQGVLNPKSLWILGTVEPHGTDNSPEKGRYP